MSWNSLNLYVALRLTQSAGRRQPPAEIQDQGLRTRGRPTTPALAVVRECPACLFMATTNASRAAVTLMIVARARCAKHSEAVYEKPYWYRDAVIIRFGFLGPCVALLETS